MRDRLKIVLTKARLDDTAAVRSLLLPIRGNRDPATSMTVRQSGFSYAYDEASRTGRFVASNGATVMSFSIEGLTRQEAAAIAEECERIAVWGMHEIRKAADRALGTSFEPVP
jgi:hypothetical protein